METRKFISDPNEKPKADEVRPPPHKDRGEIGE